MFSTILWLWIACAGLNLCYIFYVFYEEPANDDGSETWFVMACILLSPIATVCMLTGILKRLMKK